MTIESLKDILLAIEKVLDILLTIETVLKTNYPDCVWMGWRIVVGEMIKMWRTWRSQKKVGEGMGGGGGGV